MKCDPTKKTVEISSPDSNKEEDTIPKILKPQAPVNNSSNSWF